MKTKELRFVLVLLLATTIAACGGGGGGGDTPQTGAGTWLATAATLSAPVKADHTAVWTGSEMIIWGGGDAVSLNNTGAKYNPSMDSWTAIDATAAPTARYLHTAVWTGAQMIVWGGDDTTFTYFNTGGKYNPSTGAWTATSTVGAPSARGEHTAVWTGTEMIVWGGYNGNNWLNTGGRYNPTADTWTATNISSVYLPSKRGLHTAVWTGTYMVVWGGEISLGQPTNDGGRYNPISDTWLGTARSSLVNPYPRYNHTVVWTGTEMIVWGGKDGMGNFLNSGDAYMPDSNTWYNLGLGISTTNAPSGRIGHTAVWTGKEMIVWGGFDGNLLTVTNTGGKYDPTHDTWTTTSTSGAPSARYDHSAVWTDSEMIVYGGFDGTNIINTGGRFTP